LLIADRPSFPGAGNVDHLSASIFTSSKLIKMKAILFFIVIGATTLLLSHRPHTSSVVVMDKAELKSFGKPDEVREFPKGKVELIKIGNATIGRATFQPGWKWSESVQPLAKTKSCEAPHFQYHVSGILMVKMDDGTLLECKPGDASLLPMGHDAWVVGTEPAVVVDFQGMLDYAKKK
jgi:hypothetical protein